MVSKSTFYSTHPSIQHWEAMIASLEERTGKNMKQWLEALKKSGAATDSERRKWLKDEHGLGLSSIGLITEEAAGKNPEQLADPEAFVDGIFSGAKAELRPLYDDILGCGLALGEDVKVCPCRTIVPFYRKHVFAQVKVPNRTTIHLGLALGDVPAEGILVSTGGYQKKDRITHRLEMGVGQMLNKEQKRWFQRAYDRCGSR